MICPGFNCEFTTKCHEILVAHVTKNHKLCLKCNESFDTLETLLEHLENVHGEDVNCGEKFCSFKGVIF